MWTVFQRRLDAQVDFYRNWQSYKNGFGDAYGDYWLGNDALHALTSHGTHSLKVFLTKHDLSVREAEYKHFTIADELDDYRLTVANFSGNVDDCLSGSRWNKRPFSTHDRDNDHDGRNCAEIYKGAWWFEECHCGHLNGEYLDGNVTASQEAHGVMWGNIHYSYKESMMMLRSVVQLGPVIIG